MSDKVIEVATISGWQHTKVLVQGQIKSAWIVYSSDNKMFISLPFKIHRMVRDQHGQPVEWETLGFHLHQESTGTWEEFLQLLANHIEYDNSYEHGVFDQWDNPIPMLKRSAGPEFFFDNFINNY